jgi:hypothetical protein
LTQGKPSNWAVIPEGITNTPPKKMTPNINNKVFPINKFPI